MRRRVSVVRDDRRGRVAAAPLVGPQPVTPAGTPPIPSGATRRPSKTWPRSGVPGTRPRVARAARSERLPTRQRRSVRASLPGRDTPPRHDDTLRGASPSRAAKPIPVGGATEGATAFRASRSRCTRPPSSLPRCHASAAGCSSRRASSHDAPEERRPNRRKHPSPVRSEPHADGVALTHPSIRPLHRRSVACVRIEGVLAWSLGRPPVLDDLAVPDAERRVVTPAVRSGGPSRVRRASAASPGGPEATCGPSGAHLFSDSEHHERPLGLGCHPFGIELCPTPPSPAGGRSSVNAPG